VPEAERVVAVEARPPAVPQRRRVFLHHGPRCRPPPTFSSPGRCTTWTSRGAPRPRSSGVARRCLTSGTRATRRSSGASDAGLADRRRVLASRSRQRVRGIPPSCLLLPGTAASRPTMLAARCFRSAPWAMVAAGPSRGYRIPYLWRRGDASRISARQRRGGAAVAIGTRDSSTIREERTWEVLWRVGRIGG
jgi:hypothetical protein